jgi:hypothetical protein
LSDKQHLQSSDPKTSRELAIKVNAKIDELLGFIEWLKTDQLKKGGRKNIENLDDLSNYMEKVSRKMESAAGEEWVQRENEKANASDLKELVEHDEVIVDLLSKIEEAVKGITGERPLPGSDDISNIQKMLALMESRIKERESLLAKIS